MSNLERASKITTQTAVDGTVGKCLLTAVFGQGLDAATTLTLLDNTAIKFAMLISTTATPSVVFSSPIPFVNLVIDQTGTGNWSVAYIPTP